MPTSPRLLPPHASLALIPLPQARSAQTPSTQFMTMKMPTEVSERIERVLSCARMVCAGLHAAGIPQRLQMHVLIWTVPRWLLLVFLLCYNGHRCCASPVKRAPSRLIPSSCSSRRSLIACLHSPRLSFPPYCSLPSWVDRVSTLFAFVSPAPLSRDNLLLSCRSFY